MKYSVIILNYNVKAFTDACLQSVLQATKNRQDVEIILADNHSTDGSQAYFENLYSKVKFIWFDRNHGFGKAYNLAVKQAAGEYLLFLNPDTLVPENILEAFENFTKIHPDFGIAGGKMIDGTGHFLPESKRGIPMPIVAFSKLTQLYKILNFKPFNNYYANHLKENEAGKTAVLTGALMFLKKDTFESVGGFDEQFFMYGEDIDLSYRILQSGKTNYYWPEAKIIHFKGESSQKDSRYFQNFLETTFQFYRKHFRSFPVMEFLMKQFFKLWLRLRVSKPKPTSLSNIAQTYFWGQAEYLEKIHLKYPQAKLIKSTQEIIQKPALLIFDTSQLSFSEIIKIMEKLRNQPIRFRFYFPQRQMIIGSDYKDALGKVEFI